MIGRPLHRYRRSPPPPIQEMQDEVGRGKSTSSWVASRLKNFREIRGYLHGHSANLKVTALAERNRAATSSNRHVSGPANLGRRRQFGIVVKNAWTGSGYISVYLLIRAACRRRPHAPAAFPHRSARRVVRLRVADGARQAAVTFPGRPAPLPRRFPTSRRNQ